MKLQNLNVVELNAQEMKETEGGFWGSLAKAVGGAIIGALACQDWGKLRDAYNAGYNAY